MDDIRESLKMEAEAEAWDNFFDAVEKGKKSGRDPYDPVNHPNHYQTATGLEAIDVIDSFVPDAYSYYMGNVLKYVMRHVHKNKKQDLEKAQWYLDKMIKEWD